MVASQFTIWFAGMVDLIQSTFTVEQLQRQEPFSVTIQVENVVNIGILPINFLAPDIECSEATGENTNYLSSMKGGGCYNPNARSEYLLPNLLRTYPTHNYLQQG